MYNCTLFISDSDEVQELEFSANNETEAMNAFKGSAQAFASSPTKPSMLISSKKNTLRVDAMVNGEVRIYNPVTNEDSNWGDLD